MNAMQSWRCQAAYIMVIVASNLNDPKPISMLRTAKSVALVTKGSFGS
jgi:hypothetical protein